MSRSFKWLFHSGFLTKFNIFINLPTPFSCSAIYITVMMSGECEEILIRPIHSII